MYEVISVENLGKKYIISHQGSSNSTFREMITENVKKIFNSKFYKSSRKEEFWALKNVSFKISQGERVGIIGSNGAGKSTLLKLLSRITEPTEGRIIIRGKVASLLEVGTGFHPELTGRENIYLNGAVLGMSRFEIKKKFDDIVIFSGVEKFLDTPVKRYSSGMYVRLAFAVAAHLETDILFIDEVLSVGDTEFQKKCLGKMEEVSKDEGRTVLFVSHNMGAIKSLCKNAILLENGKIIYQGDVFSVSEYYLKKYSRETSNNSRIWSDEKFAPQNESIILRGVRIVDDKCNAMNDIYTNTPFNIEIEFKIKKENSFAGLTIIFYDNENNIVFSSICNNEPNWYGKPMPKGLFKSIVRIPGNLFNNVILTLSIYIFGKGFENGNKIDNIIQLEILDSPEIRGDYFGGIGGLFRPKLEWKTFFIN